MMSEVLNLFNKDDLLAKLSVIVLTRLGPYHMALNYQYVLTSDAKEVIEKWFHTHWFRQYLKIDDDNTAWSARGAHIGVTARGQITTGYIIPHVWKRGEPAWAKKSY